MYRKEFVMVNNYTCISNILLRFFFQCINHISLWEYKTQYNLMHNKDILCTMYSTMYMYLHLTLHTVCIFFKLKLGRISHTCILLLQANGACWDEVHAHILNMIDQYRYKILYCTTCTILLSQCLVDLSMEYSHVVISMV